MTDGKHGVARRGSARDMASKSDTTTDHDAISCRVEDCDEPSTFFKLVSR
jgi:hypothetical protein